MPEPIVTEVFVPSDYPTYTYVQRTDEDYEKDLRNALRTPKTPISISGPSKTGKTALVQKVVGSDNLIPVYGSQIRDPDHLWDSILAWIDAPTAVTSTTDRSEAVAPQAGASAKLKLPGVEVGVTGGIQTTSASASGAAVTTGRSGLAAVEREIANTDFVVFVDDFHYIARDLQESVGKLLKSGSELGIRFCIASVPHRSDDVVRSNHELRGRTANIDTKYWSIEDLKQIARCGFDALNVKIDEKLIEQLAHESCTSPQLMQALCLELCFQLDIEECHEPALNVNVGAEVVRKVLNKASTRADHSSLLKQMHAGPRVRGTERKEFQFSDGSRGDVYRASLLALAADPPRMEFTYPEILARIAATCNDEKPVGGSVTEALKQISATAAAKYGEQRIVEWDEEAGPGTFSIIDPYFLFYIRSSSLLEQLGTRT